MRIAIIVKSLKFGGMERAACNQADAFFQSGHDVDLIYFSSKNKAIAPKELGVNVIHMDINKLLKSSFKGFIWDVFSRIVNIFVRRTYPIIKGYYLGKIFQEEFIKLEKQNSYNLVLIRGQGTFEQIWSFKDLRSVRICVNVSLNTESSFKTKMVSKVLFEDVNVNCIANGTKEFYIEKFKRENIKPKTILSIKNPFFKENILNLTKMNENDLMKEPYILGLGRLVNAKNFALLIESYKIMKDIYNIKYKLLIVGDGSEREKLEKLTRQLNLVNDVVFVGYQKNPYVWISNAEAIVLTSKFEGLCNVLVEAMCCQTRIVINRCPGGMNELMINKLKNNIAEPEKHDIAKKVIEVLSKSKEYYFDDYKELLEELEPKSIVNQWVSSYIQ